MLIKKTLLLEEMIGRDTRVKIDAINGGDAEYLNGSVFFRLLDAAKNPLWVHDARGTLTFTVSYLGMKEKIPNGGIGLVKIQSGEWFARPNFSDLADTLHIWLGDNPTLAQAKYLELHVKRWGK